MSESPGPVPPGTQISLYDHALHLHHLTPDSPLPRNGEPYPDHDDHGNGRREQSSDSRRAGMAAAAILDAHFARPDAPPSELAWAFHDVDVPIVRDDHIAAAALRADRERVHETGRWLVRYSPDRCSVLIGLALLAMDRGEDDIELIQIVGLLS
ncbi:MAG: hypothetical protein JWN03_5351, partial [Nocardia sp.]|uniref:hypothetical protein n=1 Tax=Nocardia sp. TaxID=1821 RepID=UPI0026156F39